MDIKPLLLLLPLTVFAGTQDFIITPQTDNINGLPMPAGQIVGYKVFVYENGQEIERFDVAGLNFTVSQPQGKYNLNVKNVDNIGRVSQATSPVGFTISNPQANPPEKVCTN